jgi:alcohol dehydrogenase class IV
MHVRSCPLQALVPSRCAQPPSPTSPSPAVRCCAVRSKRDYAELASMLGLGGATDDEKVLKLIEAVEELKRKCDIPVSIKDIFQDPAKDAEFVARVDA